MYKKDLRKIILEESEDECEGMNKNIEDNNKSNFSFKDQQYKIFGILKNLLIDELKNKSNIESTIIINKPDERNFEKITA